MDACNQQMKNFRYYYLANHKNQGGVFEHDDLSGLKERHKVAIKPVESSLSKDYLPELINAQMNGVVIELYAGYPGFTELKQAQQIYHQKIPVWFYWPKEKALEFIDEERRQSYWRHLVYIKGFLFFRQLHERFNQFYREIKVAVKILCRGQTSSLASFTPQLIREKQLQLSNLVREMPMVEKSSLDISHTHGCYLRFDFWARIKAGGSYGHTCYVANELNKQSELVVLMPNRFQLLDTMGVKQVVLENAGDGFEENLILANNFYYTRIKSLIEYMKPAYIYERICLGNYVGARLSREYGIPYVVEYNGSEISMMKSFGNTPYQNEDYFLKAEEIAFKQANTISVISQVVAEQLKNRGVPPEKILVNPNGADPDVYKPATAQEKCTLKATYHWDPSHVIIGFIGTFGGWHGIDVLAKAIAPICQANPAIRFLLIGDGNYKYLIEESIRKYSLSEKVKLTGMVSQSEAIDLLKMCDIYVSPHSNHMNDSLFFGSPTKIYEYMALAGGIVASDLMQIGEVLSPALHADELADDRGCPIQDERAILCQPGNLEEFVNAVVYLSFNPQMCQQLGANARQAVIEHYSWEKHVKRLCDFVAGKHIAATLPKHIGSTRLNDSYKAEVQKQWDNDPCGSHYVKKAQKHTLEWFQEAEKYRYDEYAPWMAKEMEFANFANKRVLEIGGGMGTDLAQFAKAGAHVYDLDLSLGHLSHAQENFSHRQLAGHFTMGDAEHIPFADNSFDVVYTNGVIHHSPNTQKIVTEIYRVLKPGGVAKVMVYAENSLHYWRNLVLHEWLDKLLTKSWSIGEVMSWTVEISRNDAKPLVKVYTAKRIKKMFDGFENIEIVKRQLLKSELPYYLRWLSLTFASRFMGWNLVLTAKKPGNIVNE